MNNRRLQALLAAAGAALLVAACGGGGGDIGPKAAISRVVVFGDSLADVGAEGFKYTVQKQGDPAGYPIFPEIVAKDFGITGQCNYFTETSTDVFGAVNVNCTNFAVEGGHINNGVANPKNLQVQMTTAVPLQSGGNWKPTDLIIVDGGGNDAFDLIVGLQALQAAAPNPTQYLSTVNREITVTLAQLTASQAAPVTIGGQYMAALATHYATLIKTNLLDKGAQHVAVLNMPPIEVTPGFLAAIAGLPAAQAQQFTSIVVQWEQAFNGTLQAMLGSDSRVAIVDFYSDTIDQVTHASTYGVTNATTPACLAVLGASMPDPRNCFDATLDSPGALAALHLPAGWWKTWAFIDIKHPTPYGHQLLAASVSRALARAGWL